MSSNMHPENSNQSKRYEATSWFGINTGTRRGTGVGGRLYEPQLYAYNYDSILELGKLYISER